MYSSENQFIFSLRFSIDTDSKCDGHPTLYCNFIWIAETPGQNQNFPHSQLSFRGDYSGCERGLLLLLFDRVYYEALNTLVAAQRTKNRHK